MCSCCQICFRSSVACAKEYGCAVEVIERLGPVELGREQVVEVEPQLLRELAGLGVALVDQLAAVLGDLPLGEVPPPRPAAPAEPVGGLVEVGPVSGLLEPVGAGQARQAAADDDDPGSARGDRTGEPAAQRGRIASPAPPASSSRRRSRPARPARTSSTEAPRAAASEATEAASPNLSASGVRAIRVRLSHRRPGYARGRQASSYSSWRRTHNGLEALSSRPFGVRSSRP